MNDLFTCYSALVENRESDLPALSMQYADYARKLNSSLEKTRYSKEMTESESSESENRGIVPIRINPGLHGRLLAFSKEADVSVASTLYAGFSVFLSRLGLGDNAVLSALHSERDRRPELSPLIGNFETILPLEISTHGYSSVFQWKYRFRFSFQA